VQVAAQERARGDLVGCESGALTSESHILLCEMTVKTRLGPGRRLPQVALSRMRGDSIEEVLTDHIFHGRKVAVVGVVGAFTPVCTAEHVPEFVRRADEVKMLGFDSIVCIVPNDPWTVRAWAERMDPEGKITFLSDGNLQFARELRLTFHGSKSFIGERPRRYMLLASDGMVDRLSVERTPGELTCTRVDDIEREFAAAA
jgi:peroxiredoxin